MAFHVPEKHRVTAGRMASDPSYGNNGVFMVRTNNGALMTVIASDGMGWEHVSASFPGRTPTWDEMCQIKDIFWDSEDCVIQYHPPKLSYINIHPNCLHLWRPTAVDLPTPPQIMV